MKAVNTSALTAAADMGPSSDDVLLAIVLPAWRAQFMGRALDSLRAQTDRRFRVYVGDDASPDDIAGVVARHGTGLDLVYHRFEENLGGRDLMAHWHRCLALTRKEPWLWVFSDDDEMEPECVAAFYRTWAAGLNAVWVVRFDHDVIGTDGQILERPDSHPARESAEAMLEDVLNPRSGRILRAQDHIFAREAYAKAGGFRSFPLGLYADTTTWLCFAEHGGVVTIPGVRVRWRAHEHGSSSGGLKGRRADLLRATVLFCEWVMEWVARREPHRLRVRRREVRRFFLGFLHRHDDPKVMGRLWKLAGLGAQFWGAPWARGRCAAAILRGRGRRWLRSLPLVRLLAEARAQRWRVRNQARIEKWRA